MARTLKKEETEDKSLPNNLIDWFCPNCGNSVSSEDASCPHQLEDGASCDTKFATIDSSSVEEKKIQETQAKVAKAVAKDNSEKPKKKEKTTVKKESAVKKAKTVEKAEKAETVKKVTDKEVILGIFREGGSMTKKEAGVKFKEVTGKAPQPFHGNFKKLVDGEQLSEDKDGKFKVVD